MMKMKKYHRALVTAMLMSIMVSTRVGVAAEVVRKPEVGSSVVQYASTPTDEQSGNFFLHGYLAEMVSRALALSPEVREVVAKSHAAAFDVDQAKGQHWPQVQIGAATPSATFGSGGANSSSSLGTVQVTTPLYTWGRISSTIDSRTETSRAADQELEEVRQKIAFDTTQAVLELMRNQQTLVQTDGYVARMNELVLMLSEIVKQDRGRGSELTQARARLLQAQASRDAIIGRQREVEVTLFKLVGERLSLPARVRWDTPFVSEEEALSAAQEHPSLQRALAEAKAATYYADSVRASRWPQINWIVSKTTQQDGLNRTQPWQTSVALQWNAFQGGSARAAERAAFERAMAGEQKAHTVLRDLEYRVRSNAELRDTAAKRAREFLALIVETDKVRRDFYQQWYHLGKRTLLDVLIAENDHYNNQLAEVNSRFDAATADLRIRGDSGILLSWLAGPSPTSKS